MNYSIKQLSENTDNRKKCFYGYLYNNLNCLLAEKQINLKTYYKAGEVIAKIYSSNNNVYDSLIDTLYTAFNMYYEKEAEVIVNIDFSGKTYINSFPKNKPFVNLIKINDFTTLPIIDKFLNEEECFCADSVIEELLIISLFNLQGMGNNPS